MVRCLVTGGAGFIGQAIIDCLEDRNDEVISLDIIPSTRKETTHITEDVRYLHGDHPALKNIDEVYHLAAIIGTSELIFNIEKAIEMNIVGTHRILQAAKSAGVDRVLYPAMPAVWLNMYSITKSAASDICRMYSKYHKLDVRIIRWLNAYGPGQKIYPTRKIIPIFVMMALRNMDIEIWGDGNQNVDLIYAQDIAKTTVELMRCTSAPQFIYDVGSVERRTVNEIADLVISLCESKSRKVYFPMRIGEDANVGWEDLLTVSSFTGINHPSTSLVEGIMKCISYYRSIPDVLEKAVRFYNGPHSVRYYEK